MLNYLFNFNPIYMFFFFFYDFHDFHKNDEMIKN